MANKATLKNIITRRLGEIETRVSSEDEMLIFLKHILENEDEAFLEYFNSGQHMLELFTEIIEKYYHLPLKELTFLEFASGHGRFTRFIAPHINPDKRWVADIYTDAMRFQKEIFKSNTIQSCTEPEEVDFPIKFDIIFVASLFSHLPTGRFEQWMQTLIKQLSKNGLLIMTTHNTDLLGKPEEDYWYNAASESRSLSVDEYGITYVSENWVRKLIESLSQRIGTNLNVGLVDSRLWNCQDIYIIGTGNIPKYCKTDYDSGHPAGVSHRWDLWGDDIPIFL